MKIEDKEGLSLDPDFWNDPKRAEGILNKEGESTEEEVEEAYQGAVKQIEEMEFRATLNKKEDELNCILQINAGAGGTESCDWSSMLERMYLMWADKNGYKTKILDRQEGEVAGIKSVEMEITGGSVLSMHKESE